MKRTALLVSMTLAVGITVGVIGTRVLTAQQQAFKRTVLLRTDLEGLPGKEGTMFLAEYEPGARSGKHYHPGHEFAYVLEGSIIVETEGQAPVTFGPGQVIHNLLNRVHVAKNGSMTEPVKLVQFIISKKGQPAVVPVK